MDTKKFLAELLNYGNDWAVKNIEKDEKNLMINIYIEYTRENVLLIENEQEMIYKIYDYSPLRTWQHLRLFEYKTYIHCRVPRYEKHTNGDKKNVKTLTVPWADPKVSYTRLFSIYVLQILLAIKEQKTTATLCGTTEIIVRSIMDNAVETGLTNRGYYTNLTHVSIDEKSFGKGHEYSTILIDNKEGKVLECVDGHKTKDANLLYYLCTGEAVNEHIEIVSMDMWKGFIKATEESAPNALICFDKFHVFKYLTDSINQTRKDELKYHPKKELLKGAKFTLLKNEENRTEKQQLQFEQIDYENFVCSQIWKARENFKFVWESTNINVFIERINEWFASTYKLNNKRLNKVAALIYKHIDGIKNAILLGVNNGFHEQCNAKIQRLLIKARGFKNFKRFRINILFYYGKLQLVPLNK